VLKPELAAALGAERFLREIETTANLRHPHILPLYDSGEAESFLYYVMPFIDGESLRDRLIREKRLPIEDALQIAKEVAEAPLAPVNTAPLDFHLTFHLAESYAMAGATERALVVVEEAVDKGCYPYEFFTKYCRFMAPLKGMPEYERIMEKAKKRWEAFARAVEQ